MGAKVQAKTYFPGSMTDLNNGFHNSVWDLYRDERSHKIPTNGNSQHYDCFLTTQATDGCNGYAKEQIRQTILKHESIFKQQLQELHRLYKKQKALMNPMSTESLNTGHFLNQVPSDVSKEMHILASSFPQMNSSFSRASTSGTDTTFSPMDSMKGKSALQEFSPLVSKTGVFEKRVIDLEAPADVDANHKGNSSYLADLNEPIRVEERETAFSAIFGNIIRTDRLVEEQQKQDSSAKRTLFGIEIGERKHTPSFVLPWRNTTFHHNNWLSSCGSTSQATGFSNGTSRSTSKSTGQNAFVDLGFFNGSNAKDSVPDNVEESRARDKHMFINMWKNRETPEQRLPPWLTSKPCLHTERIQTKVHHINLESLQNHSQQFFKKTENADSNHTCNSNKEKADNTKSVTKILGVPIIDKKVENHSEIKDITKNVKHHIDLNLSLDDEDGSPAAPLFPESVVKIATMEIDLEAPAVLEPDPHDDTVTDLVKGAAEAIVSISLSVPAASSDTLLWFAEVVTSKKNKDYIPEGMDYFEYMTLKLEDTEDKYYNYDPMIVEEQKEDKNGSLLKRPPRKGQGRRGSRHRKDFQKDILPSIVSLSRREVTEDLQIFEEALAATGVSWHSSLSKRKAAAAAAARNGRVRRRLVATERSCNQTSGERTICMGMSLEKSLEGWGRRTRRLPRQRCQNGGNHNQSLALKC